MRERYYVGEWRHGSDFPIPQTEYTTFYPTASHGLSQISGPQSKTVSYDARSGEAAFDMPCLSSFEFAGHAKLKLWIEVEDGDNADLFITLRKIDRSGKEVHFPWLTIVDTGPIAFGWLRVSRRELDKGQSTPWQPYHSHRRDLPSLKQGEIVPVEVEIQPTSCRFRPGEKLRLVVSGHDYGEYPKMAPIARHENTVNQGRHIIHFGGDHDSHLLLPVIPAVPHSYSRDKQAIKMSIVARRVKGWSDEKFLGEYTGTHASMTKAISDKLPILRNYTQVVACPAPKIQTFPMPETSRNRGAWDCQTTLGWSSLSALWGSFKHPDYKSSAGSHVFVEEAGSIGILSVPFKEFIFDPITWEQRKDGAMVVLMLAKSDNVDGSQILADLGRRAETLQALGAGTGLLRVVLNKSVTPSDPKEFFEDTPFVTADWTSIVAMEQYWFSSLDAVTDFFRNVHRVDALSQLPASFSLEDSIIVVGWENIVVAKDISF